MTITKKNFFNNYKDVLSREIQNYYNKILKNFKPRKKKILLFVQCSKTKPYSSSLSHKYIRKAILDITGYDPYENPNETPFEIIVISSLIGPVPYKFEKDYLPTHYNLSVNKVSLRHFTEIKPILVDRISKFIFKVKDYYEKIIFFVKNNYRSICEEVCMSYNIDALILPKRKLHMIREAWIELEFILLNLLIERIIIQPISKELLIESITNEKLNEKTFTIKEFIRDLELDKSKKQVNNYLLTLRKLKIFQKEKNKYKYSKKFLTYISNYSDSVKSSKCFDLVILRDFIFKYSDLKYNLRYILYLLVKYNSLNNDILSKKMNINKFSTNLYLTILKWLKLIKKYGSQYLLTSDSFDFLENSKYLQLLSHHLKISDFS